MRMLNMIILFLFCAAIINAALGLAIELIR